MDWFSRSDEEKIKCFIDLIFSILLFFIYVCALTAQHVVVGVICDGVDVRRSLGAPLAFVGSDHGGRVDGEPFVWIHRHTEEPRVGLGIKEDGEDD